MKIYKNPPMSVWSDLCLRPVLESNDLEEQVNSILRKVKTYGDKALKDLSIQFDGVNLESFKVSSQELADATEQISSELKAAIAVAAQNISIFHTAQKSIEEVVETMPGVKCWRKAVAIEKVGLYIPGGTAPLFSTLLMLGIPAKLAGCSEITLCTPPDKSGKVHPAILYVASYLGIENIYKIGGSQAIAAMAFGTESISKVDKIFGPGNQYVTKAKELILKAGIAIDMPAGPSEVLIIADEHASPEFVAADLLSQAEHGVDSQVLLVTTSEKLRGAVQTALDQQLRELPRADIARKALENSVMVVFDSLETCFDFSNLYAPEHLIIQIENYEDYLHAVKHAGSVFLGKYSCESVGDYASGTNHTLPTNGYARSYSGVSLDSFMKKISFQQISASGLLNLGKTIEVMAEAEQLVAHKNAVSIRLKEIKQQL